MPDRRRLALSLTAALCVSALAAVVALGDLPLSAAGARTSGRTRAAVALRDHVIPFQKWGTKLFTLPHLEEAYDRVYYLTQESFGDKREELERAVTDALVHHDDVDLFLLAHGNRFVEWVSDIDPALRAKLRLVYNTGCGGAVQAHEWLAVGADAYVGHPAARSLSPVFYVFFLRRWVRGRTLSEAVGAGNLAAERRLAWFGLDGADLDASAIIEGARQLSIGGAP